MNKCLACKGKAFGVYCFGCRRFYKLKLGEILEEHKMDYQQDDGCGWRE